MVKKLRLVIKTGAPEYFSPNNEICILHIFFKKIIIIKIITQHMTGDRKWDAPESKCECSSNPSVVCVECDSW